MKILVCCNRDGIIGSFSGSKVLQCFDISDFSVKNFNYDERSDIDIEALDSMEKRADVINEQEPTLLICGPAGADEEKLINRRIAFMPGCVGTSEDAVKAILSGRRPAGLGCSGDCGSCGGGCAD